MATFPTRTWPFLQKVLYADAVAASATGLLLLSTSEWLAGLLQLPQPLLFYAGLSFLPYALIVILIARNPAPRPAVIWALVAYNALWTVESLLLVPLVRPNTLGLGFMLLQAGVIGLFAVLQWIGLKRQGAARHKNKAVRDDSFPERP